MHRQLDCYNIWLYQTDSGIEFRIANFSSARDTQQLIGGNLTIIPSENRSIQAPELDMGSGVYDEKCDVWSLGCLIYFYIAKKYPPFSASNKSHYNRDLLFSSYNFTETQKTIIKRCLEFDPQLRPSVKEVYCLNNNKELQPETVYSAEVM